MTLFKKPKNTAHDSVTIQSKKYNTLKNEFMNLGKITLITPPDKLFNMNLSYLLIKPSNHIKQQFQAILSQSIDDLNVFIYDNEDECDVCFCDPTNFIRYTACSHKICCICYEHVMTLAKNNKKLKDHTSCHMCRTKHGF
jgi:hypothetical protein